MKIDNNDSPVVSVIIPTYNRIEYVQIAVESVLNQTYDRYELIVVDDGSTDDTIAILKNRFGDAIRCARQENLGESVARNNGIDIARGDYIAFLDSDDLWLPHKLEEIIISLKKDEETAFIFSSVWVIDANGEQIGNRPMMPDLESSEVSLLRLLMGNFIQISSLVVRKDVLRAVGAFDPIIKYGEDWDLILRLFLHGYKVAYINEPLACFRRHQETQCHYPSLDSIDHRFADHRDILQKTLEQWPSQVPESNVAEATAYQYALEGLASIMLGSRERSFDAFRAAIDLESGILTSRVYFGQSIIDHAMSYAEVVSDTSWKSLASYLDQVFGLLNKLEVGSQPFNRWVRSRTYMTIGFYQYRKMRLAVARSYFLKSVREDPTALGNFGVLSILFESVFGSTLATGAKGIGRRVISLKRLVKNAVAK